MGQVASARAALELLASRADEANQRPWPEFAEYSCSACHHDLRPGGARRRADGQRPPGLLPLNDWYFALLRPSEGPFGLTDPAFDKALDALRREMARPLPDRGRVAREAGAAARALSGRLTALDRAPARDAAAVRQEFDALWKERAKLAGDWDGAAQSYLALAALYNALTDLDPGQRDPAVRDQLRDMAAKLRSAPGFAGPR